jgi:nucleoside 2-deoxyribosyltransferase
MPRIYLAGPIAGLSYNSCTNWREYALNQLKSWGIEGLSPMRAKENLAKERFLQDNYEGVLTNDMAVVTRDRNDVMYCDLLLANVLGATEYSRGTGGEIFWADAFRKPIVLVIEPQGNPHDYSMIRGMLGFRVETLDEGLLVAKTVLNR